MATTFQKELAVYEAKKRELLAEAAGKFIVIRGEELAGIWDTYEDALQAGYEISG